MPMQALDRILAIVESVSRTRAGASPARVAEETGLSLSTVVRLMQQLHDAEVLLRVPDNGAYRIGPTLITLVGRATNAFDVRAAAAPILEQLRDTSGGETASLHVRVGHQRTCVAAAYTTHLTGRIVPIGLLLPLTGSAVGHVLLAQLNEPTFDHVLTSLELPSRARKELRRRVERVQADGYDESADESVEGVRGVSVAIGGPGGNGALSVSGPTDRFTADMVPATLVRLRHASDLFEQAGLEVPPVQPS